LKIDAKTRLCAVIGNPVEHSLSPLIHNAAFEETGLNIRYVAFRVEDLAATMAGVKAMNLLGLSVTIPHKVAILPHLDEVEEVAGKIGSVNTILHKGTKLIGFNSDGTGALRALQEAGITLENKRILMLGSGGAARAIAFALGAEAALKQMILLGIETDECQALWADLDKVLPFPVQWEPLTSESVSRHTTDSDGIIHCTPIGMSPHTDESLVDKQLLRPDLFVFDIVYTPLKTRLLKEAHAVGCQTVPGVEMFLHQAAFQFELWTGIEAPMDCMRRVVMASLA
jgi:shikimate dehydrogenase